MAKAVVQLRKDVSRQARMAHLLARWLVRPVFAAVPLTPWSMRVIGVLERAALQRPAPRWASVEPVQFGDFEAEWVRSEPAAFEQVAGEHVADTGAAKRHLRDKPTRVAGKDKPAVRAAGKAKTAVSSTPKRGKVATKSSAASTGRAASVGAAASVGGAAGSAAENGAVLYFHGGGFLFCGLGTHRPAVASISRASGLPALSVAYRQLPTVQLRGSIADCVASYRFLLDQGTDPEKIVLAGDSAGGHLAFAATLQAISEGLPRPAGIVAISPWLDLDCEAKLSHPNGARDAYAPVKRLPKIAEMIAGGVTPIDPLLSPVNHDLSVLPPALIIAAEGEILRYDSELMAERLAAAGVPCVLQIWEGQVHAFPVAVGLFPEAGQAIREIGSFVRGLVEGRVLPVSEAS